MPVCFRWGVGHVVSREGAMIHLPPSEHEDLSGTLESLKLIDVGYNISKPSRVLWGGGCQKLLKVVSEDGEDMLWT